MICAVDLASSSRMVVAKQSHEFQPMGGAGARSRKSGDTCAARKRMDLARHRRADPGAKSASSPQCKLKTMSDFAGRVNDRPWSVIVAVLKATGWTKSGLSNVSCASIAAAVNKVPLTCEGLAPGIATETAIALCGSRFTSKTTEPRR